MTANAQCYTVYVAFRCITIKRTERRFVIISTNTRHFDTNIFIAVPLTRPNMLCSFRQYANFLSFMGRMAKF